MPECREGGSAGAARAEELSVGCPAEKRGEDGALLEHPSPCSGMQCAEMDELLQVAQPWNKALGHLHRGFSQFSPWETLCWAGPSHSFPWKGVQRAVPPWEAQLEGGRAAPRSVPHPQHGREPAE